MVLKISLSFLDPETQKLGNVTVELMRPQVQWEVTVHTGTCVWAKVAVRLLGKEEDIMGQHSLKRELAFIFSLFLSAA